MPRYPSLISIHELAICLVGSDRFTHRPWPRAPRNSSYDDSTLKLKIYETAQRHNFTIYLETSGNANVYSRLLSVQLQHDNVVHLGVREMQAVCMAAVTKKNEKGKKRCLIIFNFPLTKSSQQRKTARHCKTPMKSNIVSRLLDSTFGCFYYTFRANRDCFLKLCMLVK